MSYISLYFLLKTGLYYGHYLGFHWLPNLALAAWAYWPLASQRWLRVRRWLLWPLALVLLYQDSFLPTPARIWSQLGELAGLSPSYLLELLVRLVHPRQLLALAGVVVLYRLLARWLRFATLAVAGIVSVPLLAAILPTPLAPGDGNPLQAAAASSTPISDEGQLKAFYANERQRKLIFPPKLAPPPFDLIVLHVCSMSWDDLDYLQERNLAFLQRFDLLFTNFNSAASYSGPSALRVFRGNCGQRPHAQLYKDGDPDCYTFPALQKAGYEIHGLLNHNGIFDSFARIVEHEAGLEGHLDSNREGLQQMLAFDGSPVYEDYGLLSRWWSQRLQRGKAPEALYYNTITLHDGNRLPGVTSRSSLRTYRPRLYKLMEDLDRFVTELEASGRPVVLVLLPEHGASLRGDRMQMAGMREIPNPQVTLVPAAIKLIGAKAATDRRSPRVLREPMSYFGLNSILADLMRDSPFANGAAALEQRLQALETTPFVAENDDVVMRRRPDGNYALKSSDGNWLPYGAP